MRMSDRPIHVGNSRFLRKLATKSLKEDFKIELFRREREAGLLSGCLIVSVSVCVCVKAFNPPLTVLIVAVDDCQGPSVLSAVRLSRGPVGPHVAFLALEQEALVPEKLPAWRRERPPAESLLTHRFIF